MRNEYRQDELKALGIPENQVLCVMGEIRERERQRREWKWAVRGTFWSLSGWKTGQRYKAANRRAFNGGDMTMLPNFDVATREMVQTFPELDGDDACQRLFDLLNETVDRMPSLEDSYRQAVDTVLEDITAGVYAECDSDEPF